MKEQELKSANEAPFAKELGYVLGKAGSWRVFRHERNIVRFVRMETNGQVWEIS